MVVWDIFDSKHSLLVHSCSWNLSDSLSPLWLIYTWEVLPSKLAVWVRSWSRAVIRNIFTTIMILICKRENTVCQEDDITAWLRSVVACFSLVTGWRLQWHAVPNWCCMCFFCVVTWVPRGLLVSVTVSRKKYSSDATSISSSPCPPPRTLESRHCLCWTRLIWAYTELLSSAQSPALKPTNTASVRACRVRFCTPCYCFAFIPLFYGLAHRFCFCKSY